MKKYTDSLRPEIRHFVTENCEIFESKHFVQTNFEDVLIECLIRFTW